jgi:16S rRNA processing protein RimM
MVGCEVFDTSSGIAKSIGNISDVQFDAGDAPLLTVMQGTKEQMVPFAEDYIVRVDTAAKRIEMKLPEGLLELDAPVGGKGKQ